MANPRNPLAYAPRYFAYLIKATDPVRDVEDPLVIRFNDNKEAQKQRFKFYGLMQALRLEYAKQVKKAKAEKVALNWEWERLTRRIDAISLEIHGEELHIIHRSQMKSAKELDAATIKSGFDPEELDQLFFDEASGKGREEEMLPPPKNVHAPGTVEDTIKRLTPVTPPATPPVEMHPEQEDIYGTKEFEQFNEENTARILKDAEEKVGEENAKAARERAAEHYKRKMAERITATLPPVPELSQSALGQIKEGLDDQGTGTGHGGTDPATGRGDKPI